MNKGQNLLQLLTDCNSHKSDRAVVVFILPQHAIVPTDLGLCLTSPETLLSQLMGSGAGTSHKLFLYCCDCKACLNRNWLFPPMYVSDLDLLPKGGYHKIAGPKDETTEWDGAVWAAIISVQWKLPKPFLLVGSDMICKPVKGKEEAVMLWQGEQVFESNSAHCSRHAVNVHWPGFC